MPGAEPMVHISYCNILVMPGAEPMVHVSYCNILVMPGAEPMVEPNLDVDLEADGREAFAVGVDIAEARVHNGRLCLVDERADRRHERCERLCSYGQYTPPGHVLGHVLAGVCLDPR